MSRFARPENFGHPIRNPLVRLHWVYRSYNKDGELLYVGCSMNPAARMKEHKSNRDWFQSATRYRLAGPFNYETARLLERQAIRTERPLFNSQTPERTAVNAAHDRIRRRRQERLMSLGMEFWDAFEIAQAHADIALPRPRNRKAFRADDLTIPSAIRADREDAESYERGAA